MNTEGHQAWSLRKQKKVKESSFEMDISTCSKKCCSSWECILSRKGNQCKATIKLSPTDEFIDQVHEHTHAPSQTEVEVTKVKSRIKRKATTTLETPQQILGTEL